jgi:hypothetical protein
VINNTGQDVTRLRFRIIELTTTAQTDPNAADLRALTSSADTGLFPINDAGTCFASNNVATTPCSVNVDATTLEFNPPAMSPTFKGGGLNSTLSVMLGSSLQNGKSINVNFKLGVHKTGTFRFLIIVEALP